MKYIKDEGRRAENVSQHTLKVKINKYETKYLKDWTRIRREKKGKSCNSTYLELSMIYVL